MSQFPRRIAMKAAARSGRGTAFAGILLAGMGGGMVANGWLPSAVAAVPPATIVVSAQKAEDWSEYNGVVAARHGVQVVSMVPGKVRAVHVHAGQQVRKGQVLVELEPEDYRARLDAATAGRNSAAAMLDEARSEFARFGQMAEKGMISPQMLDKARARLLAAEAGSTGATAAEKAARTQFNYTVVRSPVDGVVAEKRVNPGDFVQPGFPAGPGVTGGPTLLTVYDPRAMWLEVRIPQRLAAKVNVGGAVSVSVPGAALDVTAKFSEVEAMVSDYSRSFLARVDLPASPALKAGMSGAVRFVSGERGNVSLPESVLVARGQLDGLFTVGPDGKAQLRLVRTGARHAGRVEILSGVRAGERVLLQPRANLRDGELP